MDIQFITSIAVIAPDPRKSRELYIDALGLPLEASPGSDYFHSDRVKAASISGSGRCRRRLRRASGHRTGPLIAPSRR
jgi:catechol 2,3-dioxygenase-like lactoylglutathione lyase family enzyme